MYEEEGENDERGDCDGEKYPYCCVLRALLALVAFCEVEVRSAGDALLSGVAHLAELGIKQTK